MGSQASPMSSGDAFYVILSAVALVGSKTASSVSALPAVRWSYVELVKSAVAYRHVVGGSRVAFDHDWSPRMRVFLSGVKRSCVNVSAEKAPLCAICALSAATYRLSDVRAMCARGEPSLAHLRQAERIADLPPSGSGLGSLLEDAIVLRPSVSLSVACFGVHRRWPPCGSPTCV